jgi:hypothetical protein
MLTGPLRALLFLSPAHNMLGLPQACMLRWSVQYSITLTCPLRVLLFCPACSIGLQNTEGIGLISYNSATFVTLGGCPLENRVYQYSIANTSTAAVCANNPDTGLLEAQLGPPSTSYMCEVSCVAAGYPSHRCDARQHCCMPHAAAIVHRSSCWPSILGAPGVFCSSCRMLLQ